MNLQDMLSAFPYRQTKAGLVLGSAPSVKIVKNINFDGVRIGVGDMPWRAPKLGPYDFWVTANPAYPLPWEKRDLKDLMKTGAKVLISSASVVGANTDVNLAISTLSSLKSDPNFVTYNQRHFYGNKCQKIDDCCQIDDVLNFGLSIQEQVNKLIGSSGPAYSQGSGVAIHGFALAVILRLNPIYIAGVEIPRTEGEYLSYRNWKRRNEAWRSKVKRLFRLVFFKNLDEPTDFSGDVYEIILEDFKNLAEIASALGISVYSLSSTSPLNQIPNISFSEKVN